MGAVFFAVAGIGSLIVAQDHAVKDRSHPALDWLALGCFFLLVAVCAASVA